MTMGLEEFPQGLIFETDEQLVVRNNYRCQVEFDDVIPGDLLIYRGSEGKYNLVHGRNRDIIYGWYFSRLGAGSWSCDYQDWKKNKQGVDRVAPSLTETILKLHEQEGHLLETFRSGDGESV